MGIDKAAELAVLDEAVADLNNVIIHLIADHRMLRDYTNTAARDGYWVEERDHAKSVIASVQRVYDGALKECIADISTTLNQL